MPLSPLNKQKVQLISILHPLRMEDNNWTEELYVFSFSKRLSVLLKFCFIFEFIVLFNRIIFKQVELQHLILCVLKHKRHSVDQCGAEQIRLRSVRATPSTLRGSPRGLNLQTLHLKGAAETTVKILLQRKHQRGKQ